MEQQINNTSTKELNLNKFNVKSLIFPFILTIILGYWWHLGITTSSQSNYVQYSQLPECMGSFFFFAFNILLIFLVRWVSKKIKNSDFLHSLSATLLVIFSYILGIAYVYYLYYKEEQFIALVSRDILATWPITVYLLIQLNKQGRIKQSRLILAWIAIIIIYIGSFYLMLTGHLGCGV